MNNVETVIYYRIKGEDDYDDLATVLDKLFHQIDILKQEIKELKEKNYDQ